MKGITTELKKSIKEELGKNDNENTSFEIRIIDDNTMKSSYLRLTRKQLFKTLELLDNDLEWI